MKIGVISDSHIPHLQPELPPALTRAFAGVELILHAGDICTLEVLRQLQDRFTLTIGVCGEADDAAVQRFVEVRQVVECAGRRIGLIHGHRVRAGSWLQRLLGGQQAWERAFLTALKGEFEKVDAIVFGHTHRPYVHWHGEVLLFNPGPAAPVARCRPSVGILEITSEAVRGDIVYLDAI